MKVKVGKLESGQGLVEYGLIIALVGIVAILALAATGTSLEDVYCSAIEGLGGEGCGFVPESWNIVRGKWTTDDQICGENGEGRIFADGFSGDDYVINIDSAELFQGMGYGVYFRSTEPDNVDGYTFQYDPGYGSGALIMRKWVNGYELNPPFAREWMPDDFDWYNTDHQVQLSVVGDTFKVSIDGQEMLTASDDTYSEGGFGLRTWDSTEVCFEGISVSNP
jgi:fructan beta-fructosidase